MSRLNLGLNWSRFDVVIPVFTCLARFGLRSRDAVADRRRQDSSSLNAAELSTVQRSSEHRPKLYFPTSFGCHWRCCVRLAISIWHAYMLSVYFGPCERIHAVLPNQLPDSQVIMLHASRLTCLCCSPYLQLQRHRVAPWILPLHPQGVEWPAGWSASEGMESSSGAWGVRYSWCIIVSILIALLVDWSVHCCDSSYLVTIYR